jgi:hypothetical protein
VVFYVDAAELAGRPIGECAGEHERVTEVRDLLGLRSEVVASGDLVAEVAELPETRLREVCPELGRVEVAHTARCDKDRGVGIERYVIRNRLRSSSRGEGIVE